MELEEILLRAIIGYLILNMFLGLATIILNYYIRHREGLRIFEFLDYSEATSKEISNDFKESFIAPILLVLLFVPIMVYVMANVMAEQLVEKKKRKRRGKNAKRAD